MSPSCYISRRETQTGPRWIVRYRLGGRAFPNMHAGSFRTLKEARTRRDFVAGEIAAGRNPVLALEAMRAAPPRARTFGEWASQWLATRVDVRPNTLANYEFRLVRLRQAFGAREPQTITPADVQEFVAVTCVGAGLAPNSIKGFRTTLIQILDYARVDPNPARDESIKMPRHEFVVPNPPTARQVEAIIASAPEKWRLVYRTLEQTGMRISELVELEWGDVNVADSSFRIRRGKSAAARRWAQVPLPVMEAICDTCPLEDRLPDRRVFPGLTRQAAAQGMRRACQLAGLPLFSPHDLRHRYASVKIAEGVPVTNVAAQIGHSKKSITLDTYSHVLLHEEDE